MSDRTASIPKVVFLNSVSILFCHRTTAHYLAIMSSKFSSSFERVERKTPAPLPSAYTALERRGGVFLRRFERRKKKQEGTALRTVLSSCPAGLMPENQAYKQKLHFCLVYLRHIANIKLPLYLNSTKDNNI